MTTYRYFVAVRRTNGEYVIASMPTTMDRAREIATGKWMLTGGHYAIQEVVMQAADPRTGGKDQEIGRFLHTW